MLSQQLLPRLQSFLRIKDFLFLAVAAFLVTILTLPLTYTLDPDFGWHLALSRFIAQHGQAATSLVGYNTWANQNLADHEWLFHRLLWPLYQAGGYGLLVLLTALLLLAACWLLIDLCKRRISLPAAILLTLALFLSAVIPMYGVRPQLILIFGALGLVWVQQAIPSLALRRLLYFLIFLTGNNLHGGFLILVSIPVLLEMQPLLHSGSTTKWSTSLSYCLTLSILLASLLIHPGGVAYWKLTLDYLSDPYYKQHIDEWRWIFSPPYFWKEVLAPFVVSCLLFLSGSPWKEWRQPRLWLTMIFAYLGIRYIRFFPLFMVIALPYLAEGWDRLLAHPEKRAQKLVAWTTGIALGVWVITQAWSIVFSRLHFPPDPTQADQYPSLAMPALLSFPQCRDHLFNEYSWGGYIVGFYPSVSVFIDGRGPQLRLPSGQTLLQTYQDFFNKDEEVANQAFQQFHLTCALLKTEDAQNTPLGQYLSTSPDWQKAYEDPLSTLFVR